MPLPCLPLQDFPLPSGRGEFERLLKESQKEVLRLQRQLSVTSCRQQDNHSLDPSGPEKCEVIEEVDEGEQKVQSPSKRKNIYSKKTKKQKQSHIKMLSDLVLA